MAKGFGKNILWSAASWLIPTVVTFLAVRVVVRGLGPSAYGVYALVTLVTGYFALLDFGLNQGVVRYLAMFVSLRYGRAMRQLIWVALAWLVIAGLVTAVSMWVLAPWLVGSLLKIPPTLIEQSIAAFRIGGVAFAFTMFMYVLALVPEAFLRYDVVSGMKVTIGSLLSAGPAIVVLLGYGLVAVMWIGVVVGAIAVFAWGVVVVYFVRRIPNEGPSFAEFRRGFAEFTWTSGLNRLWSTIQSQTSGVVVGIAGGAAQAGYFFVPMMISSRLTGLLLQMNMVLIPTGSQLVADGQHDVLVDLYKRSSRLFFVMNASAAGGLVVFSAALLRYWVGPQYAEQGALALSLLMLAAAVNATSMTATHVDLALGRPRVPLAWSLINSAVNLGSVYFLTVALGITGTALSGFLAALVVPFFLWYSHRYVIEVSTWGVIRDCYLRAAFSVAAVAAISWFALRPLASSLLTALVLVAVVAAAGVGACALSGAITPADWVSLRSALRSMLRRGPQDELEAETASGSCDE